MSLDRWKKLCDTEMGEYLKLEDIEYMKVKIDAALIKTDVGSGETLRREKSPEKGKSANWSEICRAVSYRFIILGAGLSSRTGK